MFQTAASLPAHANLKAGAQLFAFQPSLRRVNLHALKASDTQWLPALADLLVDGVHHGASLGFLAPLSRHTALDHWLGVLGRLSPLEQLWIACDQRPDGRDGQLLGALQMTLCEGADAHHRGELRRLMVHSRHRNRGITSQLICRAEVAAAQAGRSLLVAQVPAGSQIESIADHLGWQRAGEIPDFAACSEGRRHSSAMVFKRLGGVR